MNKKKKIMKTTEKKNEFSGFSEAQKLTALILLLMITMACSSSDNDPMQPAAQKFGNVSGTVLDATGNAYQNVKVRLEASGVTKETAITNSSGTFQMNLIEVGNYNLSITKPLGSDVTSTNPRSISINDGATTTADFTINIKSKAAFYVVAPNDPLLEVRNVSGGTPTGNDLLYTPVSISDPSGPNNPILAPDGHHVSLDEWKTASGTATVSCDGGITKYSLEFTNLIPDGVYTIWNNVPRRHLEPTDIVDLSADFSGMGALGNGVSNIIVASATGEGSLEIDVPAGNLSMFGTLPPCVIADGPGLVLVMNYHIDGKTYGDTPGPDPEDVAHLLIYY